MKRKKIFQKTNLKKKLNIFFLKNSNFLIFFKKTNLKKKIAFKKNQRKFSINIFFFKCNAEFYNHKYQIFSIMVLNLVSNLTIFFKKKQFNDFFFFLFNDKNVIDIFIFSLAKQINSEKFNFFEKSKLVQIIFNFWKFENKLVSQPYPTKNNLIFFKFFFLFCRFSVFKFYLNFMFNKNSLIKIKVLKYLFKFYKYTLLLLVINR